MQVSDVALFMNRQQGFSKGCGFVSFKERPAAEAAIANLNEKKTMPVSQIAYPDSSLGQNAHDVQVDQAGIPQRA